MSEENNIHDDLKMCGFEEVKYKDLKVGDNIIFTYTNTLSVNGAIFRHAVVAEKNGYCIVNTEKSDGVMLQPGNLYRDEKYYRRYSKS